ncbi:hypothetical protein EYF80_057548 [Liparis tanakae]|uniref:Uncharacterized protein n=1 Tax=Liparis tanakae TaxID=230148 RepID=A0A4Z2ETW4_9TELE|nr:hypothetical protein EYF80_057548 [Liparis tanakae]
MPPAARGHKGALLRGGGVSFVGPGQTAWRQPISTSIRAVLVLVVLVVLLVLMVLVVLVGRPGSGAVAWYPSRSCVLDV